MASVLWVDHAIFCHATSDIPLHSPYLKLFLKVILNNICTVSEMIKYKAPDKTENLEDYQDKTQNDNDINQRDCSNLIKFQR